MEISYGARPGPPIHFSPPRGTFLDSNTVPRASITSTHEAALNTKCKGRRMSTSSGTSDLSVVAVVAAGTGAGATGAFTLAGSGIFFGSATLTGSDVLLDSFALTGSGNFFGSTAFAGSINLLVSLAFGSGNFRGSAALTGS